MTIGAIIASAGTIANAAAPLKNTLAGIFSGNRCKSDYSETLRELTNAINLIPPAERQRLVAMANAKILPTGDSMARFYLGGKDCLHKNVHPNDQIFLEALPEAINKAIDASYTNATSNTAAAITGITQKHFLGALGAIAVLIFLMR